jgi:hypothetical protein
LLVGHRLHRDIPAFEGLHGLPVQTVRDFSDGLQIALLCLLGQFVSDDAKTMANPA